MKRNLLSSIVIATLISTGLTACDDQKENAPAVQAAESQPESASSSAAPTATQEADNNDVLNQKLNVYVECYNNLQLSIYRAVERYAHTFADFRTGPTGKENNPSPLVPIYPAFIEDCRKDIKTVAEVKPVFDSLDSAALAFSDAASTLANTINEMNKYYDQGNYKDDNFAGAKEFHTTFIKQFDVFDPIAKKYVEAITVMSRQRSVNEIKATEAKEGKSIKYYTLLTMLEAETINDEVYDDAFDVTALTHQLADFENHIQQLDEKIKEDIDKHRSFPGFISELEKFQAAAKKRLRRVRDKVAYSEYEQQQMNDGSGERVEGSYTSVVAAYNDLIGTYNGYHLEREF